MLPQLPCHPSLLLAPESNATVSNRHSKKLCQLKGQNGKIASTLEQGCVWFAVHGLMCQEICWMTFSLRLWLMTC